MAHPNPNRHPLPPIPDNSVDSPVRCNRSAAPSHNQPPVPPQPRVTGDGLSQSQMPSSSSGAQGGRQASIVHSTPFIPVGPPQNSSLARHQVPGATGTAGPAMVPDLVLTSELNRIPPPSLARLKQDLGLADRDVAVMTREEKMRLLRQSRDGAMRPGRHQETRIITAPAGTGTENTPGMLDAELHAIPPPTLARLKRRLRMAGKDVATMTSGEKMRLVQLARHQSMRPQDALPPGTGVADPNLFGINFQDFADLDPSVLMDDASVDFERDFAAWFNPDSTDGP